MRLIILSFFFCLTGYSQGNNKIASQTPQMPSPQPSQALPAPHASTQVQPNTSTDTFSTNTIMDQDAENARTDSLNFDDTLVEGMNRNPFDSLTDVEKKDAGEDGHLYHKKSNFKREMRQSAQEMGFTQ